jgi:hypothetical protein
MRALAVVLLAVAVAAGPAQASRGVAIDLGRVELRQALTPGGSYRLPAIGVRNPGTETTSYELHARPVELAGRAAPDPGWFRFSPARLTLEPGATTRVAVRVQLPTDARRDDYVALVGPQIVTSGGGARVGAAAASRVTFTVEPASLLEAWRLALQGFFGRLPSWVWLVPAAAVLAAAARVARRRFTFSVERRLG